MTYPRRIKQGFMHLTPNGAFFLAKNSPKNPVWTWSLERVDALGRDTLLLCNGRNSVTEIIEQLCIEYSLEKKEITERVKNTLEFATWKKFIIMDEEPSMLCQSKVTGTKEFYVPMHMHIEVTDKCNFRCIHCYRDCGPQESHFIDCDKLERALTYLNDKGLRIVEITGGEPLMHPEIKRIISFCVKKFDIVALITNGYLLNQEFVDYFKEALQEKKLFVSVSLNSYDKIFNDKFTGKQGSWEQAGKALKLLGQVGALSRFSMNVVPDNMEHLEKTAEFAYTSGASLFTFSPIMPFGRGINIDWSMVPKEKYAEFDRTRNKIMKKYGRFIFSIPDEYMLTIKNGHCGAGQSSFALSPQGYLRPCVTCSEALFNFGNIFEDSVERVLNNKISMCLDQVEAPNSKSCSECKYENFCNRCWYRGVIASAQATNCKWLEGNPLKDLIKNKNELYTISHLSNLEKYHSLKEE